MANNKNNAVLTTAADAPVRAAAALPQSCRGDAASPANVIPASEPESNGIAGQARNDGGTRGGASPTNRGTHRGRDDAFCMYIGPTVNGVITYGTIFGTGKAQTIRELGGAIEQYPRIAALIVPGGELPEARVKVSTPGNYLYEAYRKMNNGGNL